MLFNYDIVDTKILGPGQFGGATGIYVFSH